MVKGAPARRRMRSAEHLERVEVGGHGVIVARGEFAF
jgi:hypothetical protein